MQIKRGETTHLPGEQGWHTMMEPVHDALSECVEEEGVEANPLSRVDPQMAFREFEANGQGGLDALLANLDGSVEQVLTCARPLLPRGHLSPCPL